MNQLDPDGDGQINSGIAAPQTAAADDPLSDLDWQAASTDALMGDEVATPIEPVPAPPLEPAPPVEPAPAPQAEPAPAPEPVAEVPEPTAPAEVPDAPLEEAPPVPAPEPEPGPETQDDADLLGS